MYQSIFVPLDGSEFSARALPAAAALARRTGASLHLAVVFDPSTFLHFTPGDVAAPSFDQGTVDRYCAQAKSWVEEQAISLTRTGLRASATLLEGTVVEALAEHATAVHADLVVMTTHGRSGINRLWLGSVASSFLTRSPAPVYLVRPSAVEAALADDGLPTGKLLVPLDGSAFSEAVLPHASRLAEALALTLELVMVVVPAMPPQSLFGTDVLTFDISIDAGLEAHARQYLERTARTVSPQATATVLHDALPARALIEYAQQSAPHAIALATHGRSGLAKLVAGSVADKLLRGAEQPLLVFHPPQAHL